MRRRILFLACVVALVGVAAFVVLRAPREPLAPSGAFGVTHRMVALDPDPGGDTAEVWLPAAGRGRWPLLLFSPGRGVPTSAYTGLASNIASHGFVVVAVPHPDSLPGNFGEMASAIAAGLVAALEDVQAQHSGVLAEHADMERVGVFGHSLGGAGAALACRLDRRFKAGMDMDGTPFGAAVTDGVPVPVLLFTADLGFAGEPQRTPTPYDPARDRGRLQEEMLFTRSPIAFWAEMRGLRHMAFADDDDHLGLAEHVAQLVHYNATGAETRTLVTQFAVAFFGRFVRGEGAAGHALAVPHSARVSLTYHWRTP